MLVIPPASLSITLACLWSQSTLQGRVNLSFRGLRDQNRNNWLPIMSSWHLFFHFVFFWGSIRIFAQILLRHPVHPISTPQALSQNKTEFSRYSTALQMMSDMINGWLKWTVNNMQTTYVMIKPDGVQRGLIGEIIGRFERKVTISWNEVIIPSEEIAREHYAVHQRPFFPSLIKFVTSQPAYVWLGEALRQ